MIFFTRRLLLLIFLQYKVLSFQTFTIFLQNTFLELCFKFVLCSLYGCPNVINVPLVFICDVHTAPLHAFRNSKLIILFKKFMINFVLGQFYFYCYTLITQSSTEMKAIYVGFSLCILFLVPCTTYTERKLNENKWTVNYQLPISKKQIL